jgi:hypothetical protein
MPDPTFGMADTDDANLENFFSRPIKTQNLNWSSTVQMFETFNPWDDFFTNKRVLNRIANFNLLRCKLKVRVLINGSGFHYGRAIMSYNPLSTWDEFSENRVFFSEDVVEVSQRPHVFLDPTLSQGGTLTLPFCWNRNAICIPDNDWLKMGTVNIRSINDLKHANSSLDPLTISVFVWAEDVSLSILTSDEPFMKAQMSEGFTPQMSDEYGSGPISRPAGVIAKVAGSLQNAPIIGPYALATHMAASTVSNVASMFGYSRPISLATPAPYKPAIMGNLCNANVADTSQKLTLDVKQELSIDPRVMGLGSQDEMTVLSIAQRESYLTQFEWTVTATSEQQLWTCRVSPTVWALAGPSIRKEIHMPACCFATLPFRNWRGSMKYRFQIVASSFHKGRLKIVWDPNYIKSNEYNTNYVSIVDIAKERDFTVEVGWGQARAMLQTYSPGKDKVLYKATEKWGAADLQHANGVISVYVVNDLTVPNMEINNDIAINVYVSAGDDFDVFEPTGDEISNFSWFAPQMGEGYDPQMMTTEEIPEESNEPIRPVADITLGPTLSPSDNMLKVYNGDPITSFRQCLKRYNYHTSITPISQFVKPTLLRVRTTDFPYYRGFAPGAIHNAKTPLAGVQYNFCKMTLLNWLTPAYVCRRGGLRWKYVRVGGDTNETNLMEVTRDCGSSGSYLQNEVYALDNETHSRDERVRSAAEMHAHTWNGTVATTTAQNPAVEVELPFFTNVRFVSAKQANITGEGSIHHFHDLSTTWTVSTTDSPYIHAYNSVAEDFNLALFTGAPIAYRIGATGDPEGLPFPTD